MNRGKFLCGATAGAGIALLPKTGLAQPIPSQFLQQITIAVNAPLSGTFSAAGRQIVDGVQAAIDRTNNFTPRFNAAFALRTFDDMDDLAQTVNNIGFAASDPNVIATIAGPDGLLITAALNDYANNQMPVIAPASTTDSLTERGFRNIFRLPTKDRIEGQLFARYLARKTPPKVALAITQDGNYGQEVAQGFVDEAKASKLAADTYLFTANKPNFAAAAAEIVGRHPDFIYLCGETVAMGPLIPALASAGYGGAYGASEGFYNADLISKYAAAMNGALVSSSFPPLERVPQVMIDLANFRARYAVTPLSAFAYAAAQIVIAATQRSGTINRLTTLSSLQSPMTYNTMTGDYQFDPYGDPIDPEIYIYSITNGNFKYAGPAHPTGFVL